MNIFTKNKLEKAWKSIYLNKPLKKRKTSKGVDQVSIEKFKKNEEKYLEELYRQLKGGVFSFSELDYYQIKRKGKKPRDIQAPTIKDRIVQKIINETLIYNIFLSKFKEAGIVGSVKGNTLKGCIDQLLKFHNNGYKYILKTDIIDYFPSINVRRLKNKINYHLVNEPELKKMLFEYLDVSKLKGIPQGPPLSPLMANLYLYNIDKYLRRRKKIKHIRYVDDLLILSKTKKEAIRTYNYISKEYSKYNLQIHPLNSKKTCIGLLNNGDIDMLGVVLKDNQLKIDKDKYVKFRNSFDPWILWGYLKKINKKDKEEKILDFIDILNYKLIGWSGAYSFCNLEKEFNDMDKKLEKTLSKIFSSLRINEKDKKTLLNKVFKLNSVKLKTLIDNSRIT